MTYNSFYYWIPRVTLNGKLKAWYNRAMEGVAVSKFTLIWAFNMQEI